MEGLNMKYVVFLLLLMILAVSCIENEDVVANLSWEKKWDHGLSPALIAIGPDDRIYFGGCIFMNLYSDLGGESDAILVALNSTGKELWGRQWDVNKENNFVRSLVVNKKNDIYLSGAGGEFILMKFSAKGSKIWEKVLDNYDIVSLAVDNSGDVFAGTNRGKIKKFSSDGTELWTYDINNNNSENYSIYSVFIDPSGNILLGGTNYSKDELEAFLIKITYDGKLIWDKQWGKNGGVQGIAVDKKGNIYVGGGGDTENTGVIKFDKNGNKIWEKARPGYVNAITINAKGEIFSAGRGKSDVNPAIAKFDENGNVLQEYFFESCELLSIACDSNDNLYISGIQSYTDILLKIIPSELP